MSDIFTLYYEVVVLFFFYGVCHGRSVRCSFNDIYTATPYPITLLASTNRRYSNQLSILNNRHHLLYTSRHHVVSVVYGFIHELFHVLTTGPRRPLQDVRSGVFMADPRRRLRCVFHSDTVFILFVLAEFFWLNVVAFCQDQKATIGAGYTTRNPKNKVGNPIRSSIKNALLNKASNKMILLDNYTYLPTFANICDCLRSKNCPASPSNSRFCYSPAGELNPFN